jgi:hypothetical protein
MHLLTFIILADFVFASPASQASAGSKPNIAAGDREATVLSRDF